MPSVSTETLTQLSYFVAAALFILGLKRMSSPVTAVSGVRWAGAGMLLATLATLAFMGASQFNLILVIAAIASAFRGGRYVHEEPLEAASIAAGAATSGAGTDIVSDQLAAEEAGQQTGLESVRTVDGRANPGP